MIEPQERRCYPRMTTECGASYRRADARDVCAAVIRNISAGGMLLLAEEELETGAMLELRVAPGQLSIPVMSAMVEVVRSVPASGLETSVGDIPAPGYAVGVRVLSVI